MPEPARTRTELQTKIPGSADEQALLLAPGQWPRTTTLPTGHKLYHGTNSIFEPEDDNLVAPAWFSSSRSVAQHFGQQIRTYAVIQPISLPVIRNRRERERFFTLFDINDFSAEDIADSMKDAGLPGWIIPNNYGRGKDDILLTNLGHLRQTTPSV